MRRLLLTALVSLVAASPASAAWERPGAALDAVAADDARSPSLAVAGGVAYSAWTEGSSVRVAQLTADGWQAVGGALNRAAGSRGLEVEAATIGGVLHVAWAEHAGASWDRYDIHVVRLGADGFETVGSKIDLVSGSDARDPALLDVGGRPYIAWQEGDATYSFEIRVARLNTAGTGWEQVGGLVDASSRAKAASPLPVGGPTAAGSDNPDLALIDGAVHVAWDETGEARVARLSSAGTSWQDVGGSAPLNPTGSATQVTLTAVGSTPFVTWQSAEGAFAVRAARLSGATWEQLPAVGATGATDPVIATVAGQPWVTWSQNGNVRVTRMDSLASTWEQPVDAPLDAVATKTASAPAIAEIGGIPFVAWGEAYNGGNSDVNVARLVPDFISTEVTTTATGATFLTRVRSYGLSYPVRFAYGAAGAGLPLRTATGVADGDIDEVSAVVDGLSPRTAYEVQAVATAGVPAPEVRGPVVAFTTPKRNGK